MALTEINSLGLKDAEVKHADLANDCVDGDNIADDSIDSEHYVAASIDHEHLANDCVDGDNIADDAVGAEHIEQLDADLSFADSAKAKFGAGNDLQIYHDGNNTFIDEAGDGDLLITATAGSIQLKKNTGDKMVQANVDGSVELYYDDSKTFETVSGGATVTGQLNATVGAFTDITGRHGRAPANTQGGTYTLVVTDAGKIVRAGGNVTIDQNVFSEGDMLVIYNDTSGDITLIQGTSFTLRLAGDSATGTRTIAQRGVCTVFNLAANEAVAGGVGVS